MFQILKTNILYILIYKMLFLFTNLFLMSNALTNRRDKSILFSRTAMIFFILLAFTLYSNTSIILLGKGIALYSGLFYIKPYVYSFSLFLYIITSIILVITSFYPYIFVEDISNNLSDSTTKNYYRIIFTYLEEYKIIEYSLIIIFVINGASLLIYSNDLISIFLSIELQSYGLYLLCAIYRDSEMSINAGLTYFLLGGLSSCIILLGLSLLYVNSGTTNLDGIYVINNISESLNFLFKDNTLHEDNLNNMNIINTYQYYIHISLVLISIGFFFKISAAPFHFWSPFVYDAIPTKVTTFVAIVAKISILIFFYELVYYTNHTIFNITWKNNLILSSLLSLIIGSVLGLTQSRIKRLFAYSTISHLGFILLTLSIRSVESTQAFFFYILQYSISNLNAFITLIAIGYSSYLLLNYYNINKNDVKKAILNNISLDNKEDKTIKLKIDEKKLNTLHSSGLKDVNLSPIQLISQIKGYYEINPILAISLGLTLFSFLGVPPLVGFFGKQMVLSAALDRGYIFMTLIAILTSVISAVYYLFIIKQLFFEESENMGLISSAHGKQDISLRQKISSNSTMNYQRNLYYKDILLSSSLANIISVITLTLTMFIFFSKETINLVNILSLFVFYID